ncbi:hypothetical protein [Arhodomonas sp. AD133]|uniref:hypothetical protein n=1 Tax=Arhodomonas sp. AD133 TaxID=3415009 RepID=UPI003EC10F02
MTTETKSAKPLNADTAYPNETETVTLKCSHVHRRIHGTERDKFFVTSDQARRLKARKVAE